MICFLNLSPETFILLISVTATMGSQPPKKFQWDDHYDFPRDLVGYGEKSFNPQWPNGAKVAVSFVINYEEGAERSVMNGDGRSEVSGMARTSMQTWSITNFL